LGLTLSLELSSAFSLSSNSSTLVSLFNEPLSSTGLTLCDPPATPGRILLWQLPPWLAMPTPEEERCGCSLGEDAPCQ
jgi:hypothetical protein